jgi:GNAT superfamily N-acetyltransferase
MEFAIKDVTERTLKDIPGKCGHCLYWSPPEEPAQASSKDPESEQELRDKKKQWILQTSAEFGNCGKILYYANVPVGYAEYGPSHRFPQIEAYESQPIGKIEEGAVFLSCFYIVKETFRRRGLGARLLDNVIADLKRRGFTAVETYARKGSPNNPSGPLEFYLKKGFRIKDDSNPEFPLVRLDARTTTCSIRTGPPHLTRRRSSCG